MISKVDIVGLQATVDDLKQAISQANPKYYPSRQRLTLPPQTGQKSGSPLVDGKLLSEYSLSGDSKVVFKDLGTQASALIYVCRVGIVDRLLCKLWHVTGWLDYCLLLGILRPTCCVPAILLPAWTTIPWSQVGVKQLLARVAVTLTCFACTHC